MLVLITILGLTIQLNMPSVVATNYYGTKNVTQSLIPLMRPSVVGARIVNVSSRLGRLNGRRNVRNTFHLP
jgi:NAD(P)-dependent dehydrogenase (short-subunit alcohol dehydrogenase family)